MLSVWEFIAFYSSWIIVSILSATEKNSTGGRKANLRAIIMSQLSNVVHIIWFYLLENSLISHAYHSHRINGIIGCDWDWAVDESFSSGLFGTMGIDNFCSTILHPHSISHDNSISSTSHKNIVFLTPCHTPDFSWMARKGHAWRILSGVELENMYNIARSCSKILSSIWKFHISTVSERIYVFEITDWFTIFLKIENSELVWIGYS